MRRGWPRTLSMHIMPVVVRTPPRLSRRIMSGKRMERGGRGSGQARSSPAGSMLNLKLGRLSCNSAGTGPQMSRQGSSGGGCPCRSVTQERRGDCEGGEDRVWGHQRGAGCTAAAVADVTAGIFRRV